MIMSKRFLQIITKQKQTIIFEQKNSNKLINRRTIIMLSHKYLIILIIFINRKIIIIVNHKYRLTPTHRHLLSLSFYVDDLRHFITSTKTKPKMIGISGCRLRSNKQTVANIKLDHYTYIFTPIESSKGRTLLDIDKTETYKIRKDHEIYKSKEIE